jgi:hypothetical protein
MAAQDNGGQHNDYIRKDTKQSRQLSRQMQIYEIAVLQYSKQRNIHNNLEVP